MKIKINFILKTFILVCLIVAIGFGGTIKQRGTSGAEELLIPVSPKGIALGGSFVSSVSGLEAIYYNPAGLSGTGRSALATFSYMNYIADINIIFAGFGFNAGNLGTFGFTAKSFDFGDIPVTSEYNTDGTGEYFSPSFWTLTGSWSRSFTDRIRFGANVKLVSESIMNESATGLAFDMGVQYILGESGLKLGVVLKNLGTEMQFTGNDLEYKTQIPGTEAGSTEEYLRVTTQAFEMPIVLNIGLSYDVLKGATGLTVYGNFVNNGSDLNQYALGTEFSLNNMLFVRGGYSFAYDEDASTFEVSSDNYIYGPSFGAGINYNITPGTNLSIDISYQTLEYFDSNLVYGLSLGF